MKKNIKDYLHLYLGCDVENTGGKTGKMVSVDASGIIIVYPNDDPRGFFLSMQGVKRLILRPLCSITDDEDILDEICEAIGVELHLYYQAYVDIIDKLLFPDNENALTFGANEMAETVRILCKHSIDAFGLIESELAIDADKISDKAAL